MQTQRVQRSSSQSQPAEWLSKCSSSASESGTVLRAISSKLTGPPSLPSWSLYITGENTNQYQVSSGECCNAGTPKIDILPGKVEIFTKFTKTLASHHSTSPSSLTHVHVTTPDINTPILEQTLRFSGPLLLSLASHGPTVTWNIKKDHSPIWELQLIHECSRYHSQNDLPSISHSAWNLFNY